MFTSGSTAGNIICSEGDHSTPPDLRILHFNDVYHVEPSSRDPVGGVARFQTMCNHYRYDPLFQGQPELLSFFSGDGFNPSLESSVTKGSHMIPILNNVPTAAACVGNHDLDLGVNQFEYLASRCDFPWLLANVLDPALGDGVPLGHARKTTIMTSSNGIKIGIIGLVEQEWLEAVNALPPNLVYIDSPAAAIELVPELRAQGAEIIVALCHQREVHDVRLAEETPKGLIDIILGGHDHHYRYRKVKQTHVLCSGSDFKQLSYIEARQRVVCQADPPCSRWDISIARRDIVSSIPEDPATLNLMDSLFASLKTKLERPVGYTAVPLDSRFTTVRTKESNLGNFVADLMRYYYDADCAILCGGTIRGDVIYPPGVLRLKDIMDCFPFEDPTVVVEVKGYAILQALENGVSHYPALEGRFPQVSNIDFVFDPTRPPFRRITSVRVGGEAVDLQQDYSVATRDYMVNGGDGYSALTLKCHGGRAVPLVKEENGILVSMLLRQHFMSSMTLGRWKNWGAALGQRWGDVQKSLTRRGSMNAEPNMQHLLVYDKPHNAKEKHVPGLVGKCLRQETFRPGSATSPPLLTHEVNQSSREKPLLPHEQMKPRFLKTTTGLQEEMHLSDSEAEEDKRDAIAGTIVSAEESSQAEREVRIARKAMRKWWRLAGIGGKKGHEMGFEKGEELGVGWTRGICPRVEGRIKIVGR